MAVVLSIKGSDKPGEIDKKKQAIKGKKKGFDAHKFLGKIRFEDDPVKYQRKVRDEE